VSRITLPVRQADKRLTLFADTQDPANPEGGWMPYVFLRWFEELIGYTTTSESFLAACTSAGRTS